MISRHLHAGFATALVAAAGLAYLGVAVLPDAFSEPHREPCTASPRSTPGFKAIFETSDSLIKAQVRLLAVQRQGFIGAVVEQPVCGRFEVVQRDLPTKAVAKDFAHEVAQTGAHVTIEPG